MRFRCAGTGPPVLKLAGLAGGVGLYQSEVDAAVQAGYKVGSLDTTGDRRDDPADGPLSWDSLVDEASIALDRLDPNPVILWGTSFGSLLALAVASRLPHRVRGLLLSLPPDPDWSPSLHRSVMRFAERRRRSVAWKAGLFQVGFLGMIGWELVLPHSWSRLPSAVRASLDARTPAATIASKLDLLWAEPPGWPRAELPVSILAGRWDTVVPPSCPQRLHEKLGGRLRWIERGGHSAAFSRRRTYQRLALEELESLTTQEPKG